MNRKDGREIKSIAPDFKIIACIMKERNDAQVYFKQNIPLQDIDEYLANCEDFRKYSYMSILFASIVRTLAQRPQLNRFVSNGRVYARNYISISLAMKKGLSDEGEETTTKLFFNGTETLDEVHKKLSDFINENKNVEYDNSTDKFAKFISKVPTWLLRATIHFLMRLEKHGRLPKKVIDLSPFHTSAFVTNVGSLGIDAIYHHLYNFGTTSLFFAIGKKKKSFVYKDDEIQKEKAITISFVGDERICDGYYYANSFKLLCKYLKNPKLLEEPSEVLEDIK